MVFSHFVIRLSCCSVTAEVKPEGVKNDFPKTDLTDGKDELFCGPQKNDATKVSEQTENTQDDVASQTLMDCGSSGGTDESVLAGSGSDAAQTHCSNGQKSKRSSSPGSVKTTCVAAHSPNPKLTLCLSISPSKGISTPTSDVEMLSPDSPICKTMFVNSSADKDHDGSAYSQQCVKDSDAGCSAKEEKVLLVAKATEDAEKAEYSGSSDMSQELIGSQDALLEGYLFFFFRSNFY